MIILGIGGNLPTRFGPPRETHAAALVALAARGVHQLRVSRLWRTAPVPPSDQPWFVNAVVSVETALPPHQLLDVLNEVEADFGRLRGARNAARGIDLDVVDYRGWLVHTDRLDLPHPRLDQRGFVLLPLSDIAPDWRHPRTRRPLADLIAGLAADQAGEVME